MEMYWFSSALLGIGILVLVFTLLSFLVEFIPGLFFRRRKELLRILRGTSKVKTEAKPTPEDLLGMGSIPWIPI